jgi:uncharacterized membrane protein
LNMRNETSGLTQGQRIIRILLGLFLIMAGIGHLTFSRQAFQAQVPNWVPMNADLVVVLSGIVEILLGTLLSIWAKKRIAMGWIVAVFFVLVFPGNIAQLVDHRDSFGLDTDLKRWLRLPFQIVLIYLALWSTGVWKKWRG